LLFCDAFASALAREFDKRQQIVRIVAEFFAGSQEWPLILHETGKIIEDSGVHVQDLAKYATLLGARLASSADDIRQQWRNPGGTRTRHFVVDDILPPELCMAVFNAFPKDADGFVKLNSFKERKKTSVKLEKFNPILSAITYSFQNKAVVELVSNIIGFKQIEPDPILYAGGLSIMTKGDFLNPHIDNSHDAYRQRYRRLNLLYYVSPDWKLEDGGNFELWDEKRVAPKTLVSRANRLVVMETSKTSWHSVSPVVAEKPRCCISNYYFSAISPDENNYYHVTSFSGRPGQRVKKALAVVDNALRNVISKSLKITTGKRRKTLNAK
jgi:Rps23 Pro-64 3,4-dihydroxylase Tpa1-like proline 4-hydroxylase